MRYSILSFLLLFACAPATQPAAPGPTPDPGPTSNPGSTGGPAPSPPDAGSPPAPATSGDPQVDACVPTAAGTPAALQVGPCPGTPPVLWSRTFTDVEVDFRGASDADGNLYWIEYDPPPSFVTNGRPFLVSADRDGQDRYRALVDGLPVDGYLLADGNVLVSQGLKLTAYAAATGKKSWSLDLEAKSPAGSDALLGMTDLGDGRIAFTRHSFSEESLSNYIVDATNGAVVWSSGGPESLEHRVLGSDGAGAVLVKTSSDLSAVDSSGRQLWQTPLAHFQQYAFLGWPFSKPWLAISTGPDICSTAHYTAAPPSWFKGVFGSDIGFSFSFGSAARDTDDVDVFRDGTVIARGHLVGTNPEDGFAAFPFHAGDHLVMLGQRWPASPGLCHPSRAAAAWFARVDATSLYQCPLEFAGESGIEAAALLPGRLIVGRRTFLTDGCTHEVQPVTIEAYALPGESLAKAGWVQSEGSPGLGRRPLVR